MRIRDTRTGLIWFVWQEERIDLSDRDRSHLAKLHEANRDSEESEIPKAGEKYMDGDRGEHGCFTVCVQLGRFGHLQF